MRHSPDLTNNASGRFPSTHWSLIIRAGSPGTPDARAALAELCSVYWYLVYAFIASSGLDQSVAVWDAATGKKILNLKGKNGRPTFSPDGKRLAATGDDGTEKVWDARTGQKTLTLTGRGVGGVSFSPDGKRLASASGDEVKVWDSVTGQETLTLKGHVGAVLRVIFSPDGTRIASEGKDGTLKIWDARPLDANPAKPSPTPR